MANRVTHVRGASVDRYRVYGDVFRFLIDGEATGGRYTTWEVTVEPGNGPRQHVHDADESFYVIEGELVFESGDERIPASAGDFIHIPAGTAHGFTNGPTPARLLSSFYPAGAEHEFREAGVLIEESEA